MLGSITESRSARFRPDEVVEPQKIMTRESDVRLNSVRSRATGGRQCTGRNMN